MKIFAFDYIDGSIQNDLVPGVLMVFYLILIYIYIYVFYKLKIYIYMQQIPKSQSRVAQ